MLCLSFAKNFAKLLYKYLKKRSELLFNNMEEKSLKCFFKIFAFVLLLNYGIAMVNGDEKNINKLLNNQAIVSRQIMCVLEKSPCDQLGRQLKAALPEVIVRNCRNCSPQQAQNAQKLTNFLQTRYPDVWAMLVRKYKNA